MSRLTPLLLSLVTLSVAFAGCAENSDNPPAATTPASGTPTGRATGCTSTLDASKSSGAPTWTLNTTMGDVRIRLYCAEAPITAQNIVNLTEKGYYDGVKFHRVIKDFMNQAGDPKTKDDSLQSQWGTGGPGYTIVDEFYCADGNVSYSHPANCPSGLGFKHDSAGVLSMANTGAPRTGGSQFFITAAPTAWLDGKHAIFGKVADEQSLAVSQAINKVQTSRPGDRPVTPVVIQKATITWG